MTKTVVTTINGTSVYLTDDGMFASEMNGKTISAASLAGLKKKLKPPAVRLRVMRHRGTGVEFKTITDIKPSRSRYGHPTAIQEDGSPWEIWGRLYLPDEEAARRLEEIGERDKVLSDAYKAAHDALRKEEKEVLDTLTWVTLDNFRDLAAAQAREEATE
jgi:cation transport regulator ChaC